ncbi:Aste57867_21417 [Aphanomyces stellatus]|uniref:Aste57867_21417 protein n=1 Tax=Aphanomyces stellatus TaxID=120398 RepID=A0A485LI57_9STRA|nr:hypothetical protein As57867_021348 [Aphanomyces stellatus]VFT98088.1 Aste57867_21417 [Aphanomyces stellatus]
MESSSLAHYLVAPPQVAVQPDRPPNYPTSKLVLTLDNILSTEECQTLIDASEALGYEPALLNVGGGRQELHTDVRNNDRCIIDDRIAAAIIWERVRPFLPPTFQGLPLVGVNERLRFLRYDPGQEFKPHLDGYYCRPDKSEMSFLTIQLYLNGGAALVGGATTIFNQSFNDVIPVHPVAGRALVFQHDGVWHAGAPVVQGRKYAIRSDVMCRLPPDFDFE